MSRGVLDRIEIGLASHTRVVSIVAVAWFWLGVGINARFVPLPEIPGWASTALFWGGIGANVVWWGFVRPAIETRRAARLLAPSNELLPP